MFYFQNFFLTNITDSQRFPTLLIYLINNVYHGFLASKWFHSEKPESKTKECANFKFEVKSSVK